MARGKGSQRPFTGSGIWLFARLRPFAAVLLCLLGRQKSATFLGSDVYERTTFVYSWYANQLGHFALGTLMIVLVAWIWAIVETIVANPSTWREEGVTPSSAVFLIFSVLFLFLYLVKEAADIEIAKNYESVFRIDSDEAVRDGLTDIFFVLFGFLASLAGHELFRATTGCAFLLADTRIAAAVLSAVIVVGLAAAFALRNANIPPRQHFDLSRLPFYYRLPKFPGKLTAPPHDPLDAAGRIEGFCRDLDSLRHVVLSGPPSSGKTSMAVGIGTAVALRKRKIRYTSYADLVDELPNEMRTKNVQRQDRWAFDKVTHLIIDDVATTASDASEFQDEMECHFSRSPEACELRKHIRKAKTVWVVSDPDRLGAVRDGLAGWLRSDEVLALRLEGRHVNTSTRPRTLRR